MGSGCANINVQRNSNKLVIKHEMLTEKLTVGIKYCNKRNDIVLVMIMSTFDGVFVFVFGTNFKNVSTKPTLISVSKVLSWNPNRRSPILSTIVLFRSHSHLLPSYPLPSTPFLSARTVDRSSLACPRDRWSRVATHTALEERVAALCEAGISEDLLEDGRCGLSPGPGKEDVDVTC